MAKRTTNRHLSIDIETYSSIPIKLGVYKYAESPDFRILIFGYAWDDEPREVISLEEGEEIPDDVLLALTSFRVTKHAYNAQFERVCLMRHTGLSLAPEQWCCTQAQACIVGLPAGLANVGKALGLEQDKQKDTTGKALIRYFSVPSKTKGRERNMPYHDWVRWDKYLDYNGQDVTAEHAIAIRPDVYDIDKREREIYAVDQRINDRGVLIDMQMVNNINEYTTRYKASLIDEAKKLTGLDNPNSNAQFLEWLKQQFTHVTSGDKETVAGLLALGDELTDTQRKVLELRQALGKTSLAKYDMLTKATCDDGRMHGVLQYYGAGRTGRWAGRLVQVQNLPRNNIKELDEVRRWVKAGDFDTLEMLYDNVPDTLSQLIRTAFIPQRDASLSYATILLSRLVLSHGWLARSGGKRCSARPARSMRLLQRKCSMCRSRMSLRGLTTVKRVRSRSWLSVIKVPLVLLSTWAAKRWGCLSPRCWTS